MTSTLFKLSVVAGLSTLGSLASAAAIDARINLGAASGNPIGQDFFTAASGFTQGDTSHTNTLTFDDGVVAMSLTVTAEGFDSGGAPAGLRSNNQSVGVEGGAGNDTVDPGESIKFTLEDYDFNVIGALPPGMTLDPDSLVVELSSIRFAAFDGGTDTYTYSGIGSANVNGDDTNNLTLVPHADVSPGDMFTITGDSGSFRVLFVSFGGNYGTVPEPTAALIFATGAALIASRRQR